MLSTCGRAGPVPARPSIRCVRTSGYPHAMTSKMSPFGSLSDRRGSHPSDTGGVVARVAHVVVDERQLGLLVAWKRTDEGWMGCVAVAAAPGEVHTGWLPATRIRQVG